METERSKTRLMHTYSSGSDRGRQAPEADAAERNTNPRSHAGCNACCLGFMPFAYQCASISVP